MDVHFRRITTALLILATFFMAVGLQKAFAAPLIPDEQNTIDVFQKASPFVVFVHRIRLVNGRSDTYYIPSGAGSGFIWDSAGHVVTNYHVVRKAQAVAVSFGKGRAIKAKIIGVEPRKDIAVLKLVSTRYLPRMNDKLNIPIANSAKLQVGQKTIAIGNPYGLNRTLTTGVVSALGRRVRGAGGVAIYDMIQTDASINPGNSGGPLLNSSGELIGINTAIFSRSGQSAGIGFAVPSNTIKRIVTQIIRYGRVIQRGIGIYQLDERIAAQIGVKGLIIGEVLPNGPAAKAGLKGTYRDKYGTIHLGDIIIAVDGERVRNYDDFYNTLEKTQLGQTITIKYLRNKKPHTVKLKTIDISSSLRF